ncbi:MAG: GerMN domain-containing protein [Christensenellales bacterium]
MRRCLHTILIGLLVFMSLAGCANQTGQSAKDGQNTEKSEDAALRKTTLYYITQSGYIVPVMRKIPWIDGIGNAALDYLRDTENNRQMLSALGLLPVLQETAEVSLSVKDGVATVSLAKLGVHNAREEQAVISCVVNTLLEIPGIEQVMVYANGKKAATLLYGTDVSGPFHKIMLTSEPEAISGSKAAVSLRMYFIDPDGECIVPIERSILQKPDVSLAVAEYVSGPLQGYNLSNGLPAQTQIISVVTQGGVVTVNFNKAFENLAETPALEKKVCKAISFTCRQFEGVKKVIIQVEGQNVFPKNEKETPAFANMI